MKQDGVGDLKEGAYFIAVGCLVAVALGKDGTWDLFNYHFYNPWAWLHGRISLDIFPAQLQSFFNPLIDFPFYWAVSSLRDDLVVLLLGIPFGLGLWLTWRCLSLLGGPATGSRGWFLMRGHQMLALTCAVTGAAGLAQV